MDENDAKRRIATLTLQNDRPTECGFKDLYTWVIWQFPKPKGTGLCGAVRPPIANHGWFPAQIKLRDRKVIVHGHLSREFDSPHAAADWLENK